ncbi:DUF779 domain-containing protein [Microbacterium sp. p3-SID338]|uniref:DUF779 domain-containing protein n=1 Tax=unclassified Microbacterium TaxID=2609290 RepID=UPI000786CDCA|nr:MULTISPECIES: DUF779 domain-containing protein [unclassified Microbacterium]KYJ96918.1 UDP-glucose 4-epimerase [Microbacterium sp. CH1]MCT1395785.1 DUF779 domain-containing protein [Microbacterium sp. p3-SID338]PMC04851.1 DUF779 domain-containing protein [Microbacterium sp. UMB0228]
MADAAPPARVAVTAPAAALVRELTAQHGPLMFHQSGGCCDGSAPMCYPVGMFLTGPGDVLLGALDVGLDDPVEVFMSASQFEYWKFTHLTIDVVPGRGAGFSVEGPTGMRFLIRSRMLDPAELAGLGLA